MRERVKERYSFEYFCSRIPVPTTLDTFNDYLFLDRKVDLNPITMEDVKYLYEHL